MTCQAYQQMASAYLDGDTASEGDEALFRHCSECAVCRSFMGAMLRVREMGRRERFPFPAGLDEAVLDGKTVPARAAVRSGRTDHPWRLTLTFPLAAAFGVVMLLLGLLIGGVYSGREQSPMSIPGLRTSGQPVTVIMMYSMPPVEVHGTRILNSAETNTILQ
jgi:predicted anti-sigma-YlaC factor YlaD